MQRLHKSLPVETLDGKTVFDVVHYTPEGIRAEITDYDGQRYEIVVTPIIAEALKEGMKALQLLQKSGPTCGIFLGGRND